MGRRATGRAALGAALGVMACLLAGGAGAEEPAHAIVRVVVTDPGDGERIERAGGVWLACELSPGPVEVLIGSGDLDRLRGEGFDPVMIEPDADAAFAAERERAMLALQRGKGGPDDWWSDFKPLDAVLEKMEEIRDRRPDLVEIFEFGRTWEGRPLLAMRITGPMGVNEPCRPGVLLNSGQHAREWITVMVNMWVAESLVSRYDDDPLIRELVDGVEWVLVPVLNPDGYEYSWTDFRMWRKNRRPSVGGNGRGGADLNRNYEVGWGSNHGSSGTPSSETYRGPAPFSEPETAALRDLTLSMPNLRTHNDMHSYGEQIMYPWGHTRDLCPDNGVFRDIGLEMYDRIEAYRGHRYDVGPVYTTIYPVSGGSVDWFYGDRGLWSMTYELYGTNFTPPPSEIRPNAEETLPATLYQGEFVLANYTFRADFDRDCDHDFFDVGAFLSAYVAGDASADFDGSGELNPDDVKSFVEAFLGRE